MTTTQVVTIIVICFGSTFGITDDRSNFNLLDNYESSMYKLVLEIDFDHSEFSGEIEILFSTKNATNFVLLYAPPNRITDISKVFNIEQNTTCDYSYLKERTDILNITCERVLKRKPYLNKISISYTALYETVDDTGLYKASYDTDNGKEHYAISQFKPTSARTVFPCFDEPRFKASFLIDVIYPEHYTALSSTLFQYNDRVNGKPMTRFLWTPDVSTYSMAVAVLKFEQASNHTNYPYINVHCRKNQLKHTETAMNYTSLLVDTLEKWTKITHHQLSMQNLDLVAIPDLAFEATGNWGLLTFREANLLDEGNNTSARNKQNIISTIALELASQWFGGSVTHDLWSNAWLSEGFARYFQYHITEEILDMELERQFIPLVFHKALESDGADASPMSSLETENNAITDNFQKLDVINSHKGASIIRMMKNLLGEEIFQAGIQKYLKTHIFKNVSPKDLLDTLSTFNTRKDVDFNDVLHGWIYKSGYPVVTASLCDTKNTVTITQKEFQPINHTNGTEDKLWKIPVTWITPSTYSSDVEMIWLTDDKPLKIEINNDSWIILNSDQTGYYRVNYDNELWHRIIFALKSDDMYKIPVSSRAQLVDDAFALAKAGELEYGMVFYLANYLVQETEFEPWYAAAKSLKHLLRILDIHNENNALANLKGLVLNWINRPNLKNIMEPKTHLHELRDEVLYDLRCHMGDIDCLRESKEIFQEYKQNNFIEEYSTRETAFCFGLKQSQSPEDDYDFLMTTYAKSDSPIEKKAIVTSLGCINHKIVLEKYLSQMLAADTNIPKSDSLYVYKTIIGNSQDGINMALDFLKDHLEGIVARYGSLIDLSDLILEPARWIVSEEQTELLTKILQKYTKLEGMPAIHQKVMKEISSNKIWFKKYSADIEAAVQSLLSNSSVAMPSITAMVFFLLILFKL